MEDFWYAVLTKTPSKHTDKRVPQSARNLGIGNVSILYKYVNEPPIARGRPAPKVAESVLRTHEYNRLPNSGFIDRLNFEGFPIGRQYWVKSDGSYNFNMADTTANFHLGEAVKMIREFIKDHSAILETQTTKIWDYANNTHSDNLTRGKATWDSINKRSVPCAMAYRVMMKFLTDNSGSLGRPSMMGLLEMYNRCWEKQEIKIVRKVTKTKKVMRINKSKGLNSEVNVNYVEFERKTLKGPEVQQYLFDISTSFCAYLKSLERGKKNRRAIASANIILRAYLNIIEEFHLGISKQMPGNTIAKGGEEKKADILETMSSVRRWFNEDGGEKEIYATEDATKWNECLSPQLFQLFHHILWDKSERAMRNLETTEEIEVLYKVFQQGFYLLGNKKIWLGEGHRIEDLGGGLSGSFEWIENHEMYMNTDTRTWFRKLKHLIKDGYLYSPYGMLMGMLNAMSTTIGMMPVTYRQDPDNHDTTQTRSSDDSMTRIRGRNTTHLFANLNRLRNNERMIGINNSIAKTFYYMIHFLYGEFTSMFFDGEYNAQFGVEVAAMRPTGQNPPDDFHNQAMTTAMRLLNGELNCFGAQARLQISINNVKRLWRVTKNPDTSIPWECRILADGGRSEWSWSSCHLSELALKYRRFFEDPVCKRYIKCVMNPDNPFSVPFEEKFTYSMETGGIVANELTMPRNMFHVQRRSNATNRSMDSVNEMRYKRASTKITKMFEQVMPSTMLIHPTEQTVLSKSLAFALAAELSRLRDKGVRFTTTEETKIKQVVSFLDRIK